MEILITAVFFFVIGKAYGRYKLINQLKQHQSDVQKENSSKMVKIIFEEYINQWFIYEEETGRFLGQGDTPKDALLSICTDTSIVYVFDMLKFKHVYDALNK